MGVCWTCNGILLERLADGPTLGATMRKLDVAVADVHSSRCMTSRRVNLRRGGRIT